MSAIDDKIAETLDSEDRDILEHYGKELGFFGLVAESFRGKSQDTTVVIILLILLFALALVFSAVYFFTAEDIEMKLNWMAVGLTALIVIGLLRLWYLAELYRISIVREIKRLELQVALRNKKLPSAE